MGFSALNMMRGYNKKYLTDDEKKSSKELVAESEGDTQTVVVEKNKSRRSSGNKDNDF